MGQRQSSQQEQQQQSNSNPNSNGNNNNETNNNDNDNRMRRGSSRILRPQHRRTVERNNPISRRPPQTDAEQREERLVGRARRARHREQQAALQNSSRLEPPGEEEQVEREVANLMSTVSEAIESANNVMSHLGLSSNNNDETNATTTTTTIENEEESHQTSPFSRMIAQVISEAVIASFRSGHIPTPVLPPLNNNDNPLATVDNNNSSGATTTSAEIDGNNNNSGVRQQLTMQLSPELFSQMEPNSTEDSFMRFLRLPVVVTSVVTSTNPANTTTAVNADGETVTATEEEGRESTRIMSLPVFLYGLRAPDTGNTDGTTANSSTNGTPPPPLSTEGEEEPREEVGRRRSRRLLAREEEQQQQRRREQEQRRDQPPNNVRNGQWTVYIISGNSVDNLMNESPSYEELLDLAALIGPARRQTVSQEAIDNHVPIVKYTQQVKQLIVGNPDGCQVCLNSYQSQDDVRVLGCHHGFHKDCIDKWLTEGRNQCPLCRDVPIPMT